MSIWLGNKRLDGGSARNVGDIFYTTRKDSGLGGAVECNGGTYDIRDYTGAGSIGELLADGKLPYVSLAEYATLLSTNGVVGVFGWNGGTGNWYGWADGSDILYTKTLTNPDMAYEYPEDDPAAVAGNITSSTSTTITVHRFGTYTRDSSKDISGTTFRVPTLQDVFIECGQASQLGNYIPAGLPNIKGSCSIAEQIQDFKGAFYNLGQTWAHASGYLSGSPGLGFDASRSNAIYGNSDTVQPKAVRYRAMVQLFNGATDQAVATVGTVVAQVGELNSHRVVDFQIPTAENGYTWYRKYADGWVEQGGIIVSNTAVDVNITYPFSFADINYTLFFGIITQSDDTAGLQWSGAKSMSTTGFTARVTNTLRKNWQASGMAA